MESIEKVNVKSVNDRHLGQLASIGQIAAGIAHEVKNPLTAVKGFLQLLQQEEEHEYIKIAQTELDNALLTLNNLLQISRPDLEDEEMQTINLSVELESILNLFQDKMYNVKVITNFQHTEKTIQGRRNQFKKVFFNLIKNAFESMVGQGTLTITHQVENEEVLVTIKDTGVGISEEKLSILGTPFFTTKDVGTGLGLTQVFSVIYQHGGKVSVESKVNQGTTFKVRVPLKSMVEKKGVRQLNLQSNCADSIKEFVVKNRSAFEEKLLDEAVNVKDKFEEIQKSGNVNLINNAYKLILYVVDEKEHELINFAKQEGVTWAKYSLTLPFKLEWIQAIRSALWDFLYNYDVMKDKKEDRAIFFSMEKRMNKLLDQFLTYFFISYSKYKVNN